MVNNTYKSDSVVVAETKNFFLWINSFVNYHTTIEGPNPGLTSTEELQFGVAEGSFDYADSALQRRELDFDFVVNVSNNDTVHG